MTADDTHRTGNSDEQVFVGLGVSPGVAIGPLHLRESGELRVMEYQVAAARVDAELDRFKLAVEKALRQLKALQDKATHHHGSSAEELSYLLEAHLQMLSSSRLHNGVRERIQSRQVNAEAAVMAEVATIADSFLAMDDPYLRSRGEEIRQVGYRILRNLTDSGYSSFSDLPANSVVIAEDITPADTALMDPKLVGGFASVLGGAEGHTAIMARSLGIPAVLGLPGLLESAEPGMTVIIDGANGLVILNPSRARLENYRQRQVALAAESRKLEQLRELPAETRDGLRMTLHANLELPNELPLAEESGAEGVGLLRTEFLFMNRADLPSQAEQEESLEAIITGMKGRPVTIRTLDVGGEKLASALGDAIGQAMNPALGLRAIRLSLKEPQLLITQLRAILTVAGKGPIRILLPMVVSQDEVRRVRQYLQETAEQMAREGLTLPDSLPPLGIMIEIPGAALSADNLAREADFFAIGTNDLIMYTLAIDRGEEAVAHLYNPMHPAVLRLLHFTVEAAQRHDRPISVCGEMAGDPRYTALFVGLGVRELSMRAKAIPLIKDRVRRLDSQDAKAFVEELMRHSDPEHLSDRLTEFNAGF
ncbi:phosphoenolpyruvate--protein phosphotransferase [Rhodovibrionaceae bacterium A322]